MSATPKTARMEAYRARCEREERARRARVATKTRLAYSTSSGQVKADAWDNVEEDDPHCFICSRHTDHFAEHDDMVEAGYAQYESDGTVTWTEKGWNKYRA